MKNLYLIASVVSLGLFPTLAFHLHTGDGVDSATGASLLQSSKWASSVDSHGDDDDDEVNGSIPERRHIHADNHSKIPPVGKGVKDRKRNSAYRRNRRRKDEQDPSRRRNNRRRTNGEENVATRGRKPARKVIKVPVKGSDIYSMEPIRKSTGKRASRKNKRRANKRTEQSSENVSNATVPTDSSEQPITETRESKDEEVDFLDILNAEDDESKSRDEEQTQSRMRTKTSNGMQRDALIMTKPYHETFNPTHDSEDTSHAVVSAPRHQTEYEGGEYGTLEANEATDEASDDESDEYGDIFNDGKVTNTPMRGTLSGIKAAQYIPWDSENDLLRGGLSKKPLPFDNESVSTVDNAEAAEDMDGIDMLFETINDSNQGDTLFTDPINEDNSIISAKQNDGDLLTGDYLFDDYIDDDDIEMYYDDDDDEGEDVYKYYSPLGLEYLGAGYDLIKGNPLGDTITLLDPGFRANIIQMHWIKDQESISSSMKYIQAKGSWIRSYVSCHKGDSITEVGSEDAIKRSLTADASVSSELPGDTAKFAASAGFNSLKNAEKKKGHKSYVSKSYCFNYVAGIPTSLKWDLTLGVNAALDTLPTAFKYEDGELNCSPSDYRIDPSKQSCADLGVQKWMKFFSIFGTHVTTKVYLGGKLVTLMETNANQEEELSSRGLDVKVALSAQIDSSTVSASAGTTLQTVDESKSMALGSHNSTFVLGGDIYGDGLGLPFDTWAASVANFSMPIKAEFTPISIFINQKYKDAYNEAYLYYGKVLVGETRD